MLAFLLCLYQRRMHKCAATNIDFMRSVAEDDGAINDEHRPTSRRGERAERFAQQDNFASGCRYVGIIMMARP